MQNEIRLMRSAHKHVYMLQYCITDMNAKNHERVAAGLRSEQKVFSSWCNAMRISANDSSRCGMAIEAELHLLLLPLAPAPAPAPAAAAPVAVAASGSRVFLLGVEQLPIASCSSSRRTPELSAEAAARASRCTRARSTRMREANRSSSAAIASSTSASISPRAIDELIAPL